MSIESKFGIPTYKRPSFQSNGKMIQKVSGSDFTVTSGVAPNDYLAFLSVEIDVTRNNAIYIAYRSGTDHNQTPNGSIVFQKALTLDSNNVPVFSSATTVIAHGGRQITDPALIVTSTGRIILFFLIEPTGKRQMWMVHSDDGGNTWSSERRMTMDYDDNQITGPGEPIEYNGVLYKPCYARGVGAGSREGALYKSIDDGLTWTKMTRLMYPIDPINGEEPTIVRLSNGMLVVLVRSDPNAMTYMCWSPDMGESNWSRISVAYPSIGKNGMSVSPNDTICGLGRQISTPFRTYYFYSNNMGKTFNYDFIDNREKAYMYGRTVWHPVINQFIAIWSVEVGTEYTGVCDIVGCRLEEVNI